MNNLSLSGIITLGAFAMGFLVGMIFHWVVTIISMAATL